MDLVSPENIKQKKREYDLEQARKIPAPIIKIFNDAILKGYSDRLGRSTVYQNEIVKQICETMKVDSNTIFTNKWLDIELLFEEIGWKIEYDKPAYFETYSPSWCFTKKKD